MNGVDYSDPGQRVFVALGEMFEQEPVKAIDTAAQAVGLVANFYADQVVISDDQRLRNAALRSLRSLEGDISGLLEHLSEVTRAKAEVITPAKSNSANDNRATRPRY